MEITWEETLQHNQIIIIGAGGIVNDAHLPAYKIAGLPVAGIYDIDIEKAKATAAKFNIPVVYDNMKQLLRDAPSPVVFDVAVPGNALIPVLQQLPDKAVVLIQKPMGNNYAEAKQILLIARNKQFIAGINFQLRYAPFINEARKIIQQGTIGELCDIEINVNVYTPWQLWKYLYDLPRVEILYHSIHYIDLVRSFIGNPQSVFAKTTKHPLQKELASVRSNIIMDYGDMIRANILTNHAHQFGHTNQQSYIKLEGTKGAIKIQMGLLMNYPEGLPDKLEYISTIEGDNASWKTMEVAGSWFPHAFIGSMKQVMQAADGFIDRPDNSVEDCIHTMACVEAAYRSGEQGGVRLDAIE
jgi:predicted dehydrogenase